VSTLPGITPDSSAPGLAQPAHVTLPKPASDTQSLSDEELVRYCRELFYRARSYRRPIIGTWNRNYRVLRNRTWLSNRAAWLPSPEVPEIRPILSQLAGWMTDQRPTYTAVAAASPHTPYFNQISKLADDLSTVIDSAAKVHRHEASIKMAIWDSYSMGTGLLKTAWDMTLDGGLGNAQLLRVDPYSFYPDPQATNEFDGNYYIEAHIMSTQEIDRRYRSGHLFPEGSFIEDVDERPTRLNGTGNTPHARTFPGQLSPMAPSTRSPSLWSSNLHAPDPNDRGVTVLECWLREHFVTQINGHDTVFDYWRCVVIAKNIVLLNVPAYEIWSHAQHPYHRFVADDEGEFWGQSLVEDLASSQISLNRLLAGIQHNIDLTGNPPFLEGIRAGLERTRIPNRPAHASPSMTFDQAKWMQVPQLHPIIPSMIQFYVTEMERISGLSAINRGFTPTGRNASDVLDSVQEAGFTRIRSHLRSLEWALRSSLRSDRHPHRRELHVPRILAITGPEGQDSAMALNANHFMVPGRDQDGQVTKYPLRFSILSQIGGHISKLQERAEAIQLFTLGALDITALLEALNYPNRQDIAQRIARLQAAGAFQPPGARQRAQH
jgi:hypothetical protein